MHAIIADLLAFSRVTTEERPLRETDLEEIARDVVKELRAAIDGAGTVVEVGQLPCIDTDPSRCGCSSRS